VKPYLVKANAALRDPGFTALRGLRCDVASLCSCVALKDSYVRPFYLQGLPAGECVARVARDVELRHAHFSLNRLVADDVAQVLLTGRRAGERTASLLRGHGGVFHFAVPPPAQ